MEMSLFMCFYRLYRRSGMRTVDALKKAGLAIKHAH